MDLAARRAQLIAELEPFGDHHERFQYVIDRAKSAPALAAELKLDAFLVEGCTSNLWLVPSLEAGRCRFRCDADFLAAVGITQHLSPNRRNGLTNLVAKIRAFGRAAGG